MVPHATGRAFVGFRMLPGVDVMFRYKYACYRSGCLFMQLAYCAQVVLHAAGRAFDGFRMPPGVDAMFGY